MPTDPSQPRAPTIDMTLDGHIVPPATTWTRLLALWRVLPRGTIPALITAAIVLAGIAILFVGFLIVALPVVVALIILAAIFGVRRPSGARPPLRR